MCNALRASQLRGPGRLSEHSARKDLKRLKLGRGLAGILITPDSSRAYCAGDNNVALVDLNTLELVDRLQTGVVPGGMAWIK